MFLNECFVVFRILIVLLVVWYCFVVLVCVIGLLVLIFVVV